MAFMTVYTSGEYLAHGRCVTGEARVNVLMGDSGVGHMTPAEARNFSAYLLQAASDAEAAAGQIIKGNADIAQTAQAAV